MSLWEEIRSIKSVPQDVRNFGFSISGVLVLVSGVLFFKGNAAYYAAALIAAIFLFAGVFFPLLVKPIQKGWMALAHIMGWVMTRVILIILYYGMMTPFGILGRLFGKEFLSTGVRRSRASYWNKRPQEPYDKTTYERQF